MSYKSPMTPTPVGAADRAEARAALLSDQRFHGFSQDLFARIIDAGQWRHVPAGARLFSAGDEASGMIGIGLGFIAFESSLAIPDLPVINFLASPFWSVGRPQVQGRIRLVSASARTALTLVHVPQSRFEALENEVPEIRDFKALVAGLIFVDTLEALTDALIPDTRHRAISTLLRVAGRKQGGETPTTVPISQTELAAITNLSRQTCGELLRGLEREGLIRLGYREIEVLAPAQLRGMMEQR